MLLSHNGETLGKSPSITMNFYEVKFRFNLMDNMRTVDILL
jgi:hypothetical protein